MVHPGMINLLPRYQDQLGLGDSQPAAVSHQAGGGYGQTSVGSRQGYDISGGRSAGSHQADDGSGQTSVGFRQDYDRSGRTNVGSHQGYDGSGQTSVGSRQGLAEILEPLPELVDDHYPRLFLLIDCEGYRKLRYSKNLHDGEALALLQPPTTFKLE
ncbi:oxoglutarate/iron-dependent dioxygenase [Artemisia annua]|uniref:Oxoglutarate/iron-dependent dioxygenase n=1 Tax=Artemisia annua TaxID=35608 RepID=A0A2U1P9R5_ARTAN|nr:oxoglutarate/iron-dependent dioxygenase [Artemisia annua]